MTELHSWLHNIKIWYRPNQSRNIDILIQAVSHPPEAIFVFTDSDTNSEALSYWFDACHRLSFYYQDKGNNELAFSYLQLAYAKLQGMVCHHTLNGDMMRWCLKKLDRMIISMMEFCQRQHDPKWQQESMQLIDLHIAFMAGQNNVNLAYHQ